MSRNIENIEKGLTDLRNAVSDLVPSEIEQDYALLLSIKALMDCKRQPSWIKGTNGRMLYVNPEYTKQFGIKVEKYMGNKDEECWDKSVASVFRDNDRLVELTGEQHSFIEDVTVNDSIVKYRVSKWPVYLNNHLVGIAGESLGVFSE